MVAQTSASVMLAYSRQRIQFNASLCRGIQDTKTCSAEYIYQCLTKQGHGKPSDREHDVTTSFPTEHTTHDAAPTNARRSGDPLSCIRIITTPHASRLVRILNWP